MSCRKNTKETLLDAREIDPKSVPVNFLILIRGTPLENADLSI
jgi:biotin synthase-like enzyme